MESINIVQNLRVDPLNVARARISGITSIIEAVIPRGIIIDLNVVTTTESRTSTIITYAMMNRRDIIQSGK